MPGWFADILIDFLARTIGRAIKSFRSRDWILVHATRCSASAEPDNLWGCRKILVTYSYELNGQHYGNYFREPFLLQDSSEKYIARFQVMPQLVLHVNPVNPADSFVRNSDQRFAIGLVSHLKS